MPTVMDVPYSSLINPAKRTPFPGRAALPEAPGLYAWWETREPHQEGIYFGDESRPVFLGIAGNLAASIEADATGNRASVLRRHLSRALVDHLGLRAAHRRGSRPPLNKEESDKISHWIAASMKVSWSELAEPEAYRLALTRALDPHVKP